MFGRRAMPVNNLAQTVQDLAGAVEALKSLAPKSADRPRDELWELCKAIDVRLTKVERDLSSLRSAFYRELREAREQDEPDADEAWAQLVKGAR